MADFRPDHLPNKDTAIDQFGSGFLQFEPKLHGQAA
jgi:hypothetical protein